MSVSHSERAGTQAVDSPISGPFSPDGIFPRTPPRRARSIRRTETVHMSWPEGFSGDVLMQGRARDIYTARDGLPPVTLAEDSLEARVKPDMTLRSLTTEPRRPELDSLIGEPMLRGYRGRLKQRLDARPDAERPLGTLTDDLSAASLISGWMMGFWPDSPIFAFIHSGERRERMTGTCIGYRPGSSAVLADVEVNDPVRVAPLERPGDPAGWHAFVPAPAVEMRRARRIDLWREDGAVHIDAMFQDSGLAPDGTRRGLHDYGLRATVDPVSWTLRTIEAVPRILPHAECSGAPGNVGRVLGAASGQLREKVLDELRLTAGCTHLNDAVRALAAVPWMVARLDEQATG